MFVIVRFFLTIFLVALMAGHTSPARQQKIIIVHGSFSQDEVWWCRGDFFQEVETTAKGLGYTVDHFAWNGGFTKKDVKRASLCLADKIEISMKNHDIILIGHSHGGNVIMSACQELVNRPTFLQLNTRIKRVITLAVPIPKKQFNPPMDVIESVINFYSEGDAVQRMFEFLGAFTSQYKAHPRVANLEIFTRDASGQIYKPGHSEVHPADIGRWILMIPDFLADKKFPGYETFCWGGFGKVYFTLNEPPVYESQTPRKCKRLRKSRQWVPSPFSDIVKWLLF